MIGLNRGSTYEQGIAGSGPAVPIVACLRRATLGVELARDELIEVFYPGGLVSNGPSSPASKARWDYCESPTNPACSG